MQKNNIFTRLKKLLPKYDKEKISNQDNNLRETLLNLINNNDKNCPNGNFNLQERLLLKNALLLSDSRIDDIMIPRAQIEAIEKTATLAQILEVFENSGYSRLPVYVETLDEPKGMIHIHDILSYLSKELLKTPTPNIDLTIPITEINIIRDILFVPGSMLANQLLQKMQASRTQMALVIDEYGGTDGLVCLEDIVELLVGDIEDEHDDEPSSIVQLPNGGWLIGAETELTELSKILGLEFTNNNFEDVDTLGGIIVTSLGYIPDRGEVIDVIPGYRCRILEANRRRIKRVRIKKINEINIK